MKKSFLIIAGIILFLIIIIGLTYNNSKIKDENPIHQEQHSDEDKGHKEGQKGVTEITTQSAIKAGIITAEVGSATIVKTITLTGRIIVNRDNRFRVRARFPGIVQSVKVKLGQYVKKGQVLATVESNDSLKTYSVTAPANGVILNRNINIGDIADNNPLFTIADLSNLWVEFHVFPRDLNKVKEGQLVNIRTLENDIKAQAPISLILPTADSLSQTIIAIVTLPNKKGEWYPGMTVEGDVEILRKKVELAVTELAIQHMEEKTVIFIKEGNKYHARPVIIGEGEGDYVEILSGLKAGETYVSQNSFIIKADILKSTAEH